MKFCPNCQSQYPDDANFCPQETCATPQGPRRLEPIVAAPAASAAVSDPHLACVYQSEGNSQCQSPGNAQLTATPQTVTNPQQYPFLFGGPLLVFHHGGNHR